MINADMRNYKFYRVGAVDEYGQSILQSSSGTIKMCINIINQNATNDVLYSNGTFMGLTTEELDSSYVIDWDGTKLKVKYVNPKGRLNQVFMELYNA